MLSVQVEVLTLQHKRKDFVVTSEKTDYVAYSVIVSLS